MLLSTAYHTYLSTGREDSSPITLIELFGLQSIIHGLGDAFFSIVWVTLASV
jgi:hypothetical protein